MMADGYFSVADTVDSAELSVLSVQSLTECSDDTCSMRSTIKDKFQDPCKKSPEEIKGLSENRMNRASLRRSFLQIEACQKLRDDSKRCRRIRDTQKDAQVSIRKAIQMKIEIKQKKALDRRTQCIRTIKQRAKDQNDKVREILFIQKLQRQIKRISIEQKLNACYNRRLKIMNEKKTDRNICQTSPNKQKTCHFLWCSVCNCLVNSSEGSHTSSDLHLKETANCFVQGNLNLPVLELDSSEDLRKKQLAYLKKRAQKIKKFYANRVKCSLKPNNKHLSAILNTGKTELKYELFYDFMLKTPTSSLKESETRAFIYIIIDIVKNIRSLPRSDLKYLDLLIEPIVQFLSDLSENPSFEKLILETNGVIPIIDFAQYLLSRKDPSSSRIFPILSALTKFRENQYIVDYMMNSGLLRHVPVQLNSLIFFLNLVNSMHCLSENYLFVLRETQIFRIPSTLMDLILFNKSPKDISTLSPSDLEFCVLSIKTLVSLVQIDLSNTQKLLQTEETYFIMNFFLQYCNQFFDAQPLTSLLDHLIILIAYFVLQNEENQDLMNRGETCILQRLCALPFAYFSNQRYINVLFPALVAACFNHPLNYNVLQQEMSGHMLVNYINTRKSVINIPNVIWDNAKIFLLNNCLE